MGLDRFELSTPRLSSVCSNQLSYRPWIQFPAAPCEPVFRPTVAAQARPPSFDRPLYTKLKSSQRPEGRLPFESFKTREYAHLEIAKNFTGAALPAFDLVNLEEPSLALQAP